MRTIFRVVSRTIILVAGLNCVSASIFGTLTYSNNFGIAGVNASYDCASRYSHTVRAMLMDRQMSLSEEARQDLLWHHASQRIAA